MSDRYADEMIVIHAHLLLALAALRNVEYSQIYAQRKEMV